jgi:hypothetical protein
VQGNADVRLDDERNAVIDWYCRGAQKLLTLIQRYATDVSYARIVGPTGAQQLVAWSKANIAGRFTLGLKPDSTVRPDSAADRKQALDLYNFLAKDPMINRQELLMTVFRRFNLDPGKLQAQPQAKKPDPANVSFRFAGADLDPTLPNFPIVLSILEQSGFSIDPAAIQAAQQHARVQSQIMNAAGAPTPPPNSAGPRMAPRPNLEHGGLADKSELLNKHQEQQTGGMHGTGQRPGGM